MPSLDLLLADQTNLYPLMEEQDLYKLIHQATLGSSHIFIGDKSGLDTGLQKEVRNLKTSPAAPEPLIEILDRQRQLVRVNLRPFLLQGGRVENLARAVGRTAHVFRGNRGEFLASLQEAGRLLSQVDVAFGEKDLRAYVLKMKGQGYPAGDHSLTYAKTYEPAYRLVLLQHLTDANFGGRRADPIIPPRIMEQIQRELEGSILGLPGAEEADPILSVSDAPAAEDPPQSPE